MSAVGGRLTVASSPGCSRDAVLRIQMAEIWGGCKVEQVSGSGGFDLRVPGEQGRPGSNASEADLREHDVERVSLGTVKSAIS